MLPKQKRQETLGRFQRLLNSLPCQAKLTAVKTQKTLEITENQFTTTYYRFYIQTQEPIDWLIEQCGFKQQPLTELPKTKTAKTFPKHLQLENNKLQRTFTVYQLPGKLLPGFVSELYGLCEKVLISVKPLPPEVASTQMGKYLRLLKSILLADQSKGRLPKEEIKLKHDMAQATYQGLITGGTRLFELKVNLTLEADTLEELKVKTKSAPRKASMYSRKRHCFIRQHEKQSDQPKCESKHGKVACQKSGKSSKGKRARLNRNVKRIQGSS